MHLRSKSQGLPWWSGSYDFALPIQGVRVQSLVGEPRSHMMPKKIKKKKKNYRVKKRKKNKSQKGKKPKVSWA